MKDWMNNILTDDKSSIDNDSEEMYNSDIGGFEPIRKDPNKKSRGDSKRVDKKTRKEIKKKRKEQKMMESTMNDMQFV